MLQVLKDAWAGLDAMGRMVVLVVLILAVAGLLGVAMFMGYKLDWLPGLLGAT